MTRRIAIVARLREGAGPHVAELLQGGPPFDPDERGLDAHAVFVSASEVVFVFEGPDVETAVSDLVDDPFAHGLSDALDRWRDLVDGPPRIARPAYDWRRPEKDH